MKKVAYFVLCILTLAGCKQAKTESVADPKIVIAEVQQVSTSGALQYSGTIEPTQTIPLTFQAQGTVLKVLVNAGDPVKAGQLLAVVDKADAQSMYEMTLAKYQQAKDAYDRLKQVHDKGSLPEVKWVEMESNLQQAQSSVALSRNNLKKCNLYAPESGVIGKRNIEPGMNSLGNLNAPIELVKINTVYVKVAVPENEINLIKKGQKATFTVSALDNKEFEGTVTNVGVVADAISRTYEVKITVNNTKLELKPGMVCDVKLNVTANRTIVGVPLQAVDKDNDNRNYVYVVNVAGKTVSKRLVTVGIYQGDFVEILSGVNLGEKVVTGGLHKLSDNSKVTL
ncbi:efflux RND transporter periplasmic adaptor subunit [Paludibacter jiangxiensis]|uniref:RND family efflux transporter, MFP subunit n=1 Tax=Paludibacter jiangxiensis TaxID=681398 RepID=A0A161LFE2_9BACT|nr:efflux RND transporter periplasmic adaptor subunit [Paludibacter jiangxiensis]GAT63755.1 RND family efflux transporter, MFP subunit [Paludibacter jiangxiensis]